MNDHIQQNIREETVANLATNTQLRSFEQNGDCISARSEIIGLLLVASLEALPDRRSYDAALIADDYAAISVSQLRPRLPRIDANCTDSPPFASRSLLARAVINRRRQCEWCPPPVTLAADWNKCAPGRQPLSRLLPPPRRTYCTASAAAGAAVPDADATVLPASLSFVSAAASSAPGQSLKHWPRRSRRPTVGINPIAIRFKWRFQRTSDSV